MYYRRNADQLERQLEREAESNPEAFRRWLQSKLRTDPQNKKIYEALLLKDNKDITLEIMDAIDTIDKPLIQKALKNYPRRKLRFCGKPITRIKSKIKSALIDKLFPDDYSDFYAQRNFNSQYNILEIAIVPTGIVGSNSYADFYIVIEHNRGLRRYYGEIECLETDDTDFYIEDLHRENELIWEHTIGARIEDYYHELPEDDPDYSFHLNERVREARMSIIHDYLDKLYKEYPEFIPLIGPRKMLHF